MRKNKQKEKKKPSLGRAGITHNPVTGSGGDSKTTAILASGCDLTLLHLLLSQRTRLSWQNSLELNTINQTVWKVAYLQAIRPCQSSAACGRPRSVIISMCGSYVVPDTPCLHHLQIIRLIQQDYIIVEDLEATHADCTRPFLLFSKAYVVQRAHRVSYLVIPFISSILSFYQIIGPRNRCRERWNFFSIRLAVYIAPILPTQTPTYSRPTEPIQNPQGHDKRLKHSMRRKSLARTD